MGVKTEFVVECDSHKVLESRPFCEVRVNTYGDSNGENLIAVTREGWWQDGENTYCPSCREQVATVKIKEKVEKGLLPDPSKDPYIVRRQSAAIKREMHEAVSEDSIEWSKSADYARLAFKYDTFNVVCYYHCCRS